jgi:hypothetical protein
MAGERADSMNGRYTLVGQTPVPCADLIEWATWFENADNRTVKRTALDSDRVIISTVFLGLDHQFFLDGPPMLFETMVFWNGKGDEQERCSTWMQAEMQHDAMVAHVTELLREKSRANSR